MNEFQQLAIELKELTSQLANMCIFRRIVNSHSG